MVLEQQRFDYFWKMYQADLPKYVFHRWKYLVLGKNFTTDVRQASLKKGRLVSVLQKNPKALWWDICVTFKKNRKQY